MYVCTHTHTHTVIHSTRPFSEEEESRRFRNKGGTVGGAEGGGDCWGRLGAYKKVERARDAASGRETGRKEPIHFRRWKYHTFASNSSMAASGDFPFPLVILCLVLIRGSSALPATPRSPEKNPARSQTPRGIESDYDYHEFPAEDYSDNITVIRLPPKSASPNGETSKRCDYDACLENQIPCANLASLSGCRCPGSTLHNEAPKPPKLKSLSFNGSDVVARWCAPHSYVTDYVVSVAGKERMMFAKGRRSGGLGRVDDAAEVCVISVNDAGASEGSCLEYRSADGGLPLKAGLIGGGLGFLLFFVLAVLLWRHKAQRKQEASISAHGTAETERRPDAQ
ncbi:leucine-rich repeat neuronal protein 4 [Spinachia spinachia]